MEIQNIILNICKKNNIQIEKHNLTQELNIDTIYKILPELNKYEISGEYNLHGNFRIDYTASRWDSSDDRPYSLMPTNKWFVWHSHPFRTTNPVDFPSIEDIDTIRLNPHMIGMIITQSGMYFMCSCKEIVNISNVTNFYRNMSNDPEKCLEWDYESISENFLNNKCEDISQNYGLYVKFINKLQLNTSIILNTIIQLYMKLPNIRKPENIQNLVDYKLLNNNNKSYFKNASREDSVDAKDDFIIEHSKPENLINKMQNMKIIEELLKDSDIGILETQDTPKIKRKQKK